MMKRLSAVIAALSAGLLLSVAANAAATAPRAQLRNFVCRQALDPANRAVAVEAVMRPVTGTRALELRFDLLVSRGGSLTGKSMIRAGDLGVWITPRNPTLGQLPGDVWNFAKPVVELNAPATYGFRVAFRWIGARNRVIHSVVDYSPPCREPELRPDLLVRSIAVTPIANQPGMDLYTAEIRNTGATLAGPFDVLFTPGDSSPAQTQAVRRLEPGVSQALEFVGPLCTAASAPTVTVDSAAQVDDLNRSNNRLTAVCPAAAAGLSRLSGRRGRPLPASAEWPVRIVRASRRPR